MPYTLNHYKAQAAKIADTIIENGSADYQYANILNGKRTKGYKAALIMGLVVGALCARAPAHPASSCRAIPTSPPIFWQTSRN